MPPLAEWIKVQQHQQTSQNSEETEILALSCVIALTVFFFRRRVLASTMLSSAAAEDPAVPIPSDCSDLDATTQGKLTKALPQSGNCVLQNQCCFRFRPFASSQQCGNKRYPLRKQTVIRLLLFVHATIYISRARWNANFNLAPRRPRPRCTTSCQTAKHARLVNMESS